MNGFLLDTNIASELVRQRPRESVTAWIAAQRLETLFLSVITIGELRKGITILPPGKRRTELEVWLDFDLQQKFAGRILSVNQQIADRWGVLEGRRQLVGRPIHAPDAQIAATAIEHGLTIVTRNQRDFEDLGVPILNPWEL